MSAHPIDPQIPAHHPESIKHAAPSEAVLEVDSIGKSYGRRQVVKHVSLNVRRGEAVGLLGPNGAGKTTCFYMITGLIRPDHGAIRLDNFDMTQLPMYRRARLGVGYLPQEASIFRGLSVEDNIRAVLEVVEPNKKRREEDLNSLLAEFGVTHLRKSPSIALSGGERRRVEIARALATRPSFMLLDEPFVSLDEALADEMMGLFEQLKSGSDITTLIVTHSEHEAQRLADRVLILSGHPASIS